MREILGGGVSTRGICKVTWRVREIKKLELEKEMQDFLSSLSESKLELFLKELNSIPKPVNSGIVPSICSNAMYQEKISNLVDKYK